MIRFSEEHILRLLGEIAAERRILFPTCCAQRLLSMCELIIKDMPKPAYDSMAKLWRTIAGETTTTDSAAKLVETLTDLVPTDDSTWTPTNPILENTLLAQIYAWRYFISNDLEDAVSAAVQCFEMSDYVVQQAENVDYNAPGMPERIFEHEFVQRWLRYEQEDLDDILRADRSADAQRQKVISQARQDAAFVEQSL